MPNDALRMTPSRHARPGLLAHATAVTATALLLASVLDVPLREQNTLLQTAGFAPAYHETSLSAPQMAQVRQALELPLTCADCRMAKPWEYSRPAEARADQAPRQRRRPHRPQ